MLSAPIGALCVSAITLMLDPDNGLRAWWSIQRELAEARAEQALLDTERRRLEERVEALRSDPFEIEKRAREDGGMMLPGERVLRCCE